MVFFDLYNGSIEGFAYCDLVDGIGGRKKEGRRHWPGCERMRSAATSPRIKVHPKE
jgi:hypothetical protein